MKPLPVGADRRIRKWEGVHSSSCSRDFSSESAGFPNSVFQTTVWINCKMPRIRVSRREFFSLQTMSSRILCPTLYPISFNLSSVYRSSVGGGSVLPSFEFCDSVDFVLCVCDHFGKEECVCRVGEFEAAGAVEVAVVDGGFARDDGRADGVGGC